MINTPVERLLAKLPNAKKNTKGWTARCPVPDDETPSLSIGTGDGGPVLRVGGRGFVRGKDCIEFVERLGVEGEHDA